MNIDGMGPAVIQMLLENDFVKKLEDLYNLENQKDRLMHMEGFGEKSIIKMLDAIEASKENQLHQFVHGLGIPLIGSKAAKVITSHFKTLEALQNAQVEDLIAIDEIGEKMAESLVDYFKKTQVIETINALRELNISFETKASDTKPLLEGLTFVLTGTLEKYGRKELQGIIESYGGKVSSSVSKKTDYVIYGDKAGSKLEKAQKLAVKTLDENAAYDYLIEMGLKDI